MCHTGQTGNLLTAMSTFSKATLGPRNFPKTDQRLLGTWKSDVRRTFSDWSWKKNTPPQKKAQLKSFFGKLLITFTRSKIISNLPHRDWQSSRSYSLLGADERSVAIMEFGEPEIKNERKYWQEGVRMVKEYRSKPEIKHIHFEKKYFWLPIGNGKHREYFRKIRGEK